MTGSGRESRNAYHINSNRERGRKHTTKRKSSPVVSVCLGIVIVIIVSCFILAASFFVYALEYADSGEDNNAPPLRGEISNDALTAESKSNIAETQDNITVQNIMVLYSDAITADTEMYDDAAALSADETARELGGNGAKPATYENTQEFGEDVRRKIWLVIGDSISTPGESADKIYIDYVAERLNVSVVTIAASGTGYMRKFKDDISWLDALDTYPTDVDFITIMGALNDFEYEVGTFTDSGDETFYGALYTYYKELTEKYPETPIGVITSPPRITCWGENGVYVGHINAVIDMAGFYSLPVLDLYRNSGLRPWDEENSLRYFAHEGDIDGDGVHLNEAGHKLIADKIYDFIVENLL